MAAGMLTRRATTATEKVSMPRKMMRVGSSVPWVMIMPVRAAIVQPSPHATWAMRLALMAES